MATIDDLLQQDFSTLSDTELLELIKHVRQRRRAPDTSTKEACKKKAVAKRKRGKAIALQNVEPLADGITQEMALKILGMLKKS